MRKRSRAIFALIFALAIVLSLSACSSSAVPTPTSHVKGSKGDELSLSQYTIGFSQGSSSTEWNNQVRQGIVDTCKLTGLGLVSTDANDSAEKQIADIEDLINSNVDVILVQTYSPEAIATTLQNAMDIGIPVIVISTAVKDADVTCTMTTDSVEIGEMAAEYLMNIIGGKGEIIQLSGKEGSTVNQNRTVGLQNTLENYPKVKLVANIACNYDRTQALTAMGDLLKVHPDTVGVFANNDEMAFGAVQAIEEAGRKATLDGTGIAVISVADGINQEVLDMVKSGKMYSQRNSTFGKEAVLTAIKILQGEPVEKEIVAPGFPITPENVESFR